MIPSETIDNWFTYHAPEPDQVTVYTVIREEAKAFAETCNRLVPDGADKTAAMRKLRETVMAMNLAIACAAGSYAVVAQEPAPDPDPNPEPQS